MTVAADHVLQSSPYMVRTKTALLCTGSMAKTRERPKAIILEDHCTGTAIAGGATKKAEGDGRFLKLRSAGELVTQMGMANPHLCQEFLTATNQQLAQQTSKPQGVEFSCSFMDEAYALKFRATLRDELMGNPLTVAAKTELLCRSAVTELAKQVVSNVNQPRFAVTTVCAPT